MNPHSDLDTDSQFTSSDQPWAPPRGPIVRVVTWAILIAMALVIFGALAAIFFT